MISVEDLINKFGLKLHPEGGYFAETYRSSEIIEQGALPPRYGGDRSFSTAIVFLLTSGMVSRLHRIASDEIWHFYLGGPLRLVEISASGKVETVTLGYDIAGGQKIQHVVPAGHWFGAKPAEGTVYSFVGCTVAPGFDYGDFELADSKDLIQRFPVAARTVIEWLT